jgi:hypothetical protein
MNWYDFKNKKNQLNLFLVFKQKSLNFPKNSTFLEITSKYIFLPINSSLSTEKFVEISEHFRHHGILDFIAITNSTSRELQILASKAKFGQNPNVGSCNLNPFIRILFQK